MWIVIAGLLAVACLFALIVLVYVVLFMELRRIQAMILEVLSQGSPTLGADASRIEDATDAREKILWHRFRPEPPEA